MGSGGLEINVGDGLSSPRLNQKTVFVGTNAAITALSPTYPGQRVMPTDTAALTINILYERNAANAAWNTVSSVSSLVIQEGPEESTTPVTTDIDSTLDGNARLYAFFTMPSIYRFYVITKLEWYNGASVAGSIFSGVSSVDMIPPQSAYNGVLVTGQTVVQAGTDIKQSTSIVSSTFIPSGTICGAWIQASGGPGQVKAQSGQPLSNYRKSDVATAIFNPVEPGSWITWANRVYIKVYYRGYN